MNSELLGKKRDPFWKLQSLLLKLNLLVSKKNVLVWMMFWLREKRNSRMLKITLLGWKRESPKTKLPLKSFWPTDVLKTVTTLKDLRTTRLLLNYFNSSELKSPTRTLSVWPKENP